MTRKLSRVFRAKILGVGATATMFMAVMPGVASAAPLPQLAGFTSSSNLSDTVHIPTLEEWRSNTEEGAWGLRNAIHRDADRLLPPQKARDVKNMTDAALEAVFPGAIERHSAPTANDLPPAVSPETSPCPVEAKACVDVDNQVAWLQDGKGHRVGPVVNVSTGATKFDTPQGTHRVGRKNRTEVSWEYGMAPMPNAVYFTGNGVAFHAGDPNILSHGCVHLTYADSERFYDHLNAGDIVYVWGAIDYGVPNGRVLR